MLKFLKKNFFLLLTLLFLLLISISLSKSWSFPDNRWPLEKGTKIKLPDQGITQKFQASRDGLTQIKILFGNSRVSHGGTLVLKVYSEDCSQLLRTSTLKTHSLKSKRITNLAFPKIDDSQGKTYCLNLHFYPQPKSKHAYLFIEDNHNPENKSLVVGDELMIGKSLAMRPAYLNHHFWTDIQELNQRISQYKPWFLKHYFLDFIGFGFILLSFLLIFILIRL